VSLFVLIHGSWHDGSAWAEVIKQLEGRGHQAFGPTIVGHGKGVEKAVNHGQCTQSIVDFIVQKDLNDIILLGHSFGGTIIQKVAEAIPERIKRLIFLNAFILKDGCSLMEELPPETKANYEAMAASSGDFTTSLPFMVWREVFINDADFELAEKTYEMLSPEPFQPSIDKLDLKKFYTLEIPRSFLHSTEDIALIINSQGASDWHPKVSTRLGLFRYVQMPGSHEVLFSNPTGLAEKIIVAGRD